MSLKVGRDGLGGEEDWTVKTGGDDDGEKGAAREIHNAIQKEAAVDVAVVVSRLYGGGHENLPRRTSEDDDY